MPTLRLTQYTAGRDQYRVVVRREDPQEAPAEAIVQFPFRLTAADQEDMRWYLEDYLQYPLDLEPIRAPRSRRAWPTWAGSSSGPFSSRRRLTTCGPSCAPS